MYIACESDATADGGDCRRLAAAHPARRQVRLATHAFKTRCVTLALFPSFRFRSCPEQVMTNRRTQQLG
jgi:hypothetical protein